jgi:hypothetical protein
MSRPRLYRARSFTVLALALAAVACGDGTPTEPEVPIPGLYKLVAWDGRTLPVHVGWDGRPLPASEHGTEIRGGSIRLDAEKKLLYTVEGMHNGVPFSNGLPGTYVVISHQEIRLRFLYADGSTNDVLGALHEGLLTLINESSSKPFYVAFRRQP